MHQRGADRPDLPDGRPVHHRADARRDDADGLRRAPAVRPDRRSSRAILGAGVAVPWLLELAGVLDADLSSSTTARSCCARGDRVLRRCRSSSRSRCSSSCCSRSSRCCRARWRERQRDATPAARAAGLAPAPDRAGRRGVLRCGTSATASLRYRRSLRVRHPRARRDYDRRPGTARSARRSPRRLRASASCSGAAGWARCCSRSDRRIGRERRDQAHAQRDADRATRVSAVPARGEDPGAPRSPGDRAGPRARRRRRRPPVLHDEAARPASRCTTRSLDAPSRCQRLLRAFADVCLAIEFAHERGVVHRDLKPANIMLGDYGEVYVLDWGVARVLARAATAPSSRCDIGDARGPDPGRRGARHARLHGARAGARRATSARRPTSTRSARSCSRS